MCFIVFLLLCCKHVVDISHFVLYFILYDMYVLPIGVIKNNNNYAPQYSERTAKRICCALQAYMRPNCSL